MTRLGSETIVIVHAALVTNTRDNSEGRDWANATRTAYGGCMVEPFLMSNKLIKEDNQDREWTQEFLRCYLPATAVIEYTDRLEWRDRKMDAFGLPQLWCDFRGNPHHYQIIGQVRLG